MEQPQSTRNYWLFFAAATVLVIALAGLRWSVDHPFGTNWDESIYLNEAQIDTQHLQRGMLVRLAGRILIKSYGRPPAYRLLSVPFLALFGFHTTAARLVTLACFALSACFIYWGTRRITNGMAAAFAVLFFVLAPQVVSASIWFSTEGPLYLATSAMLYYLFVSWTDPFDETLAWIGLGLAVGLGLWSKVSFLLVALPVLAFWILVGRRGRTSVPCLASQGKACLLAFLVALPWWLPNFKLAASTTEQARAFVRDSLGSSSLAMWFHWSSDVVQTLLGYGLSLLILLVVISYVRKAVASRDWLVDPVQRLALGACACAGLPLIAAQLSGTNDLPRHITPAIIPLAITMGILAENSGYLRSKAAMALSAVIFSAQLLVMVAPVLVPNSRPVAPGLSNASLPWQIMVRHDQWDWSPVQKVSARCGVGSPTIAYLGGSRPFTQPAIEFPWAAQALSARSAKFDYPEVTWLWRSEEGPPDWRQLLDSAEQSDIVITAPQYAGVTSADHEDNQYNAQFADRLLHDPHFREPIRLKMGRFEPVEVWMFLNNSLVCPPDQHIALTN